MSERRKVTRAIVDSWVERGFITGYFMPDGLSEEQETALLTQMFDLAPGVEGEEQVTFSVEVELWTRVRCDRCDDTTLARDTAEVEQWKRAHRKVHVL